MLKLLLIFGLAPLWEAQETLPCDLKTVEEGFHCGKCNKVLAGESLEGDKCKACRGPARKVQVCVKVWIPRCGMHEMKPHLEGCCKSKFCCKFETLKSAVIFTCKGCGLTGRSEAEIPHGPKEHEKKIERKCDASGTQPHGGEPIK